VLLLNVNRAAVRCKAIVFQNLSMEELFMNNINFYNKPIIVLLLGCMHVGNSYCMENGENALTLRGQLKGRANWITSLSHLSENEESTVMFDDIQETRYVHGRNESGINIIDLRKQYEHLIIASNCKIDWENILKKEEIEKSKDDFDIHYTK